MKLDGPTRVMLVEQHSVLRTGLEMLLHGQSDIELVHSIGDVQEAMKYFFESRPHVVLMDVDSFPSEVLKVIGSMVEEQPGVRIIALIRYEWDEPSLAVIKAGACMVIEKDRIASRLLSSIREMQSRCAYSQRKHPGVCQ